MVEPDGRDRSDTSDDVTASEAATYAFCAKAWHLEHVLGKAPSLRAAARRARGVRQHEQHGARIGARTQRSTKRLAVVLVLLILATLVLRVLLVHRT
jgi:hypothetical protein